MTAHVPLELGMLLAATLFVIGLVGVMVRRNLLFVLISLEVMLNAGGLAFVIAGAHWGQADGQVLLLLVLAIAAAESAVGLAIVLQLHRRLSTLDTDDASRMRG